MGKAILKPKFKFKERHVQWNWQKSPSNGEMVRYHFVIADDRFIESKAEKIISNFQEKSIMNYPFEEVRRKEGEFKDTGLKYLFVSYDTAYAPEFLSFEGVTTNFKKDPNLRERQGLTIEDYVSRLYE